MPSKDKVHNKKSHRRASYASLRYWRNRFYILRTNIVILFQEIEELRYSNIVIRTRNSTQLEVTTPDINYGKIRFTSLMVNKSGSTWQEKCDYLNNIFENEKIELEHLRNENRYLIGQQEAPPPPSEINSNLVREQGVSGDPSDRLSKSATNICESGDQGSQLIGQEEAPLPPSPPRN